MGDVIKELREKANHYKYQATKAVTEREREILLKIATESDHLADQLEVLRQRKKATG
jgi:hypothetical protein